MKNQIMSNEHHKSGRRPNKAELERDHPDHRDKHPLGQAAEIEHHESPGEKGKHIGLSNIEELKRLDAKY
jgi:hypothetical protein